MNDQERVNEVIKEICLYTSGILHDYWRDQELGEVVLPFVILRRIDCVLKPVSDQVRAVSEQYAGKVSHEKLDSLLRYAAGKLHFYNVSRHSFESLRDEPRNVEINFNNYIDGFSEEVHEILEYFRFKATVSRLIKHNRLYEMVYTLCYWDFGKDAVNDCDMNEVFNGLIRYFAFPGKQGMEGGRFSSDVNELLCAMMFATEKHELTRDWIIRAVFDPVCGAGGLLNQAQKYVFDLVKESESKPLIYLYGQDRNETAIAIAKGRALIAGENARWFKCGSVLSDNYFKEKKFHYMLSILPAGMSWRNEMNAVKKEAWNWGGRFFAGLPRVSDSQFLFLQDMISKMTPEGSRIGVVMSGTVLWTGGAGSGESDIRKWIIEQDWLDCIVGLPKGLYSNGGTRSYLLILTNKKEAHRRGKVQLINAVDFYEKSRSSFGRKVIGSHQIEEIVDIYSRYADSECCRIFNNEFFGYYQFTVKQPERLPGGEIKKEAGRIRVNKQKTITERVLLSRDVKEYFNAEILPFVDPDSWIDYEDIRIGYEINFDKYFYCGPKQRSSEDIRQEIVDIECRIAGLFNDLFG